MVALDGEFFRADGEGTMLGFRFPAYVELPPQVDLEDPALAAQTHAAVEFVERG